MNNHFKIIIPLYNVEKWIKICLRSVKAQSYCNFECIIIDDISNDNSMEIIKKEIKGDNRFKLVVNKHKAYALKNIYDGINLSNPDDEDIIITLDGDDWLANKDVLKTLNEVYYKQNCWITYGSYAEYPSKVRGKFAKKIPQEVISKAAYRSHEWCSSHLRTFKHHLWKQIRKEDLLDSEGNFYKMTWDLAFMFPMLEMSGNRSFYIEDIVYIYNLGNPLNDHKVDNSYQRKLEMEIRNKPKYSKVGPEIPLVVGFVDNNINYATSYNDALEKNRPSNFIIYNRSSFENNEITVFTDRKIKFVDNVKNGLKVAWIMEPRELLPHSYKDLEDRVDKFDFILTYDSCLLKRWPDKCIFTPADGVSLDSESIFLNKYKKQKMCSHIYSNKKTLEGHKLRHEVGKYIKTNKLDVDMFGSGAGNFINLKSQGLREFYFSIIIENNKSPNYFTEKIIDCFVCKAIPIYYGAPNIEEWFDKESIIVFNSMEELKQILNNLSKEEYLSKLKSLEKNRRKALSYYDYDKIIYKNIIKGRDRFRKIDER
jgi:glycosyltransferase involved in cell wall biosynthesis